MRASLYRLGMALFDEPRRENHEAVRSLMWRVIYRSPVDARWVKPLLEIADAHERESRLHQEFQRLFVSPHIVARPYGSHWLEPENEPMGRTTLELSKLMRRHGFTLDHRPGMLPDHLVAELEFMAHLIDAGRTNNTRGAQQHLLHDHLGAWLPDFTQALLTCQPSRFYRMAAHYLTDVIARDLRTIESPRPHPVAA